MPLLIRRNPGSSPLRLTQTYIPYWDFLPFRTHPKYSVFHPAYPHTNDEYSMHCPNKYENLLYIHGHIHDYLDENNFYTWNGVASINLPRSTEIVDYEPGDGIVVEVYENEVLIRIRNFAEHKWMDIEHEIDI